LTKFTNNTNNKQKILEIVVATQYNSHIKCVLIKLQSLYHNWISTSNSDNNNNNIVWDLSTIVHHYMNESNWDATTNCMVV
jgi:hypothetical protein